MDEFPLISVIIPVKNEAILLDRCLGSLQKVDYPKERLEIIIADGQSLDNTREVALRYGAKVVTNEKEIVVSGRNCGFNAARGDIIVFTDADCTFDVNWLKNGLRYFQDELVCGVGGLTLMPSDSTSFEKAVNFLFALAGMVHSTAHRQKESRARNVRDIPGCNAMYRRQALEKVMPVDEGLLTAEDVWMNYCVRRLGCKFILAPDVRLWHYRRNSPRRFLRQMYRFAIGRAQVGKKSITLLNPFHIGIGLSLPLLAIAGTFCYATGAIWMFFEVMIALFILISVAALIETKSPAVILHLPLVIVLFTAGWSAGFLKEQFLPLKEAKGK